MAQLWNDFEATATASHSWLVGEGFIDASVAPNLEELADNLEIALKEWRRASDPRIDDLVNAKGQLQRAVIRAALLNQDWWERPGSLSIDLLPLASHRALLQKLTAARQPGQAAPWIFTTNYDLAIEWTAETMGLKVINGFDGLHMRTFAPHNFDLGWRNVQARGEARFGTYHVYLAKLHGSLTWLTDSSGSVLEHSTTGAWEGLKDFLAQSDGELPGLMVLPSATKYDRTVGFVLGEMFRRLAEFLSQPQAALIVCGYSFSDEHLNRLLVTALQNPTLQLVICAPEAIRDTNDDLDASRTTAWLRTVLAHTSP